MKKITANLTALMVMILLLAAATHARAQQVNLKGTIPFEFSVKNKVFPAGEYRIVRIAPHLLALRSGSETCIIMAVAALDENTAPQTTPQLIFVSDGGRYALSEIWPGGTSNGYPVPMLKQLHATLNVEPARTLQASIALPFER